MATCPPYGCVDPWDDVDALDLCPELVPGGMSAFILFDCTYERANITADDNPDVLDPDKINALLAASPATAKLVTGPNMRLTLNAPSAVETDTFQPCGPQQLPTTYDRTITLEDANVNANRTRFYNSIDATKGFVIGAMLVYECGAHQFTLIEPATSIQFVGGRNSPSNDGENQRFEKEIRWRSQNDPDILDYVSGINGL